MIFNLMKPVPVQTETWETFIETSVTTTEEQILESTYNNCNGLYTADFTYGWAKSFQIFERGYEGYLPQPGDTLRVMFNGYSAVHTVVNEAIEGANYVMCYVGNRYVSGDYNLKLLEDNGGDYCVTFGTNLRGEYNVSLYTRTAGTYNLKIERMVT